MRDIDGSALRAECVESMVSLNNPFRGRFAIRNNLSLFVQEKVFAPDGVITRDTIAGMADRCKRILVDVSCHFE